MYEKILNILREMPENPGVYLMKKGLKILTVCLICLSLFALLYFILEHFN
jgi:hypothetical protein